jgi:spermidine synthase
VRSYLRVFPRGSALLATFSLETPVVGLVSRRDGGRFDLEEIRHRLATMKAARPPPDFGIVDDLALLGGFIAGPASLAAFAGAAPLNTDDHPVVPYLAPRITYSPTSTPRDRLLEFLANVDHQPGELLVEHDGDWQRRLAAYWVARNRYLELGRDVRPTYDVREMLAQVRGPLLAVLHISPDFRPAYDPLLRMAHGIAPSDSVAARELLVELARKQPARPEAGEALRAMSAAR